MNAHHWLILHGRYVCVARTPRCPECVIRELCEFPEKTGEVLPAPAKPKATAPAAASRPKVLRSTRKIEPARNPAPGGRAAAKTGRGVQPMAKTSRAGTRRGRTR